MKEEGVEVSTLVHAINRFKKRLGLQLSETDFNDINKMIIEGGLDVELMKWRKGNDICVYKVKWNGLEFYAIFHLVKKEVITFKTLDSEIFEHYGEYWLGEQDS
ncbi:hypothetical protein A9Q84_14625 [Halobacteriovorax marinus]|uniref:Uncharacterized protein n=1 Tax=Halobacteriovorax marinus TaxID=97084 RepID=A0A1Y5FAE8_9BACT|nr:hypothetical protein A9Q84_14625 [Halobacteriovorax marinus]